MKNLNKRGEAITLSLAVITGVAILLGFLFRPIVDKTIPIFGGQQKYVTTEKVKVEPIRIKIDGKTYMAEQIITTTSNSSEEAKMTLFQKVLMLPKIITILVFLGCLFPPLGAIFLWIYNKLKGGLKQIVTGIEEAKKELPIEAIQKLDTNLSKKSDQSTKTLVKKIKVSL